MGEVKVKSLVRFAAVLAVLLLMASACGDDESGEPGGSGSTKASESSGTATAGESESADPAYPVEGPVSEHDSFSIRVPTPAAIDASRDWIKTGNEGARIGFSGRIEFGLVLVSAGDITSPSTDLEANARVTAKSAATLDPPLRRVDNRTHDGVEFWVQTGRDADRYNTTIGGVRAGYQWNVSFDLPGDWPEADAWIDAMIASIEWKTPAP